MSQHTTTAAQDATVLAAAVVAAHDETAEGQPTAGATARVTS